MMSAANAMVAWRQCDEFLDHSAGGVVVYDANGHIVHTNRFACELLGQNVDSLKGLKADPAVWSLVCADGSPMMSHQFPVNVVLQTGNAVSQLVLGVPVGKSTQIRWVICEAYPEFDSGKLQRVVVCFTDCIALKSGEQELQKSEERLSLILKGSSDASWDHDLVTDEVYYCPRWWSMVGYTPGELAGDANMWLELTHPDDMARVTEFLRDLLLGKSEGYSIELRLRHREGHYVPILSRGFVSRDVSGKALRISGTNTDLTERKQAEQRIYELAYHDHLTGLPNRRLLIEELGGALARSQRSRMFGALVFLDLDNFKLLNDTMGHEFGDLLLRQVAERLRRTLRHSDQLGRLGGDEFVLVLEDLSDVAEDAASEAQHVLDKLQAILAQPYHLDGRLFISTPSMGVALFGGTSSDIETLLKQADLAMYRAKADGRNTSRFFDPSMQASADHQAALERALHEGLAKHQFVLFCQPQFNGRGRLVGAEVLVRWRRANGELLSPEEFIGLAESSGLIVPLGQYILEESCRALARWSTDRILGKLPLAVNVSAHQLRSDSFAESVSSILLDTGAPPNKLCLELTENVFAKNALEVAERMHSLCRQGLHFSLDDFGTGHSSLAYLKRFPLAALKIDRSFVHNVHLDPNAAPIIKAIIALARNLKLDIVAKGVEHEAQRSFLLSSGCRTLQGYLLGQPVPIIEFERMYSSR